MKKIRSKSNFVYGIIVFSIVMAFSLSILLRIFKYREMNPITVIGLSVAIVVSLVMFISGMQIIKIGEKGITLEIFSIPVKEILWGNICEVGIGKIRIDKKQFMKQLYVSGRHLSEKEYENLETLRFARNIIWFDYFPEGEEMLVKRLSENEK